MRALFQTFFDIIRLRKGPDAIPYSWILCLLVLTLWMFVNLTHMLLTPSVDDRDFLISMFTGVVALACYASFVVSAGFTPRLLQTITAVLGCSAILNFVIVGSNVFLQPFLGEPLVATIARITILWSLAVEGHILARAIDRPIFLGIVIAIAVFIFQIYLYAQLNPAPTA